MRPNPPSENVVIQVGNRSQHLDSNTMPKRGGGRLVYEPLRSKKDDNDTSRSMEHDHDEHLNCTEFLRQGRMQRHIEYYFQNATKHYKVSFYWNFSSFYSFHVLVQ